MKYKYHLAPNAFEELPGMEEPDATKILSDSPSGADYEVLDNLMDDYRAHLSTLHDGVHNPMIPGSPECREVFSDGQVVEKRKEIQIMPYSCNEVHCRCGYSTPVAQHCVSRRDRVVPVLPTDEDKIWNELISKLAALELFAKVKPTNADGIENWKRGKIAELKKQYHLTRK